jgi:glutathione S-transferase
LFNLFFDLGRAYPIRTCFGIAKVDFEDEKIGGEELNARRGPSGRSSEIPLGQLPVLVLDDGRVVTQSIAIARYAAKLAGLYPEDPLEALFVDEMTDTVGDIIGGIPRNIVDPDSYKKAREEYAVGKLRNYFSYVAEKLKGSSGPYLLGDKLTMADLVLYGTVKYFRRGLLDHIPADYDAQWPEFQRHVEAVEANPVMGPFKL